MKFLLRSLGILLTAALIAIAVFPLVQETATSSLSPEPVRHRSVAFAPLPPVNIAASRSILEKSPFIQGRSAFDRETASIAPRPPPEVRLTGISRLGKGLRASLRIDGQLFTVKMGDQTPLGVVSSIEDDAIIIDGPSSQRFEMSPR